MTRKSVYILSFEMVSRNKEASLKAAGPLRTIVIGDVHGCLDELDALLDKLAPSSEDQLIFLGDLINRGPDSVGVLQRVASLPNTRLVMGNHELRLLQYRQTGDVKSLKDYDWPTLQSMRREHWGLLQRMEPFVIDKEHEHVFVHGGFMPGIPWRKQSLDLITSIQVISLDGKPGRKSDFSHSVPWADTWQGPPFVVYGHTPRTIPQRNTWALGIDTACVYGGHLTAYVLPQKELVQVKAEKAYI